MPARHATAAAEGTNAKQEGSDGNQIVKPLPGRVFNAENIAITGEGRIFVTGSEAVYELGTDGTLNNIPVENVPPDCMKNGITTDGNFLYLACARVHSGDNPLVPRSWCDITGMEQTPASFARLLFAEMVCQVETCIVRASLRGRTLFDKIVAKEARFFANGIASYGGSLYVANSFPGLSAGIYRVPGGGDATVDLKPWHQRVGCAPNGVKVARVRGSGRPQPERWSLYYTGFQLLPVPSSVLVRVEIEADGSAGQSEVVYRRLGAFFDDFDVVEHSFVIADAGDVSISPLGSGALLFVDGDGRLVNTFKHEY